MRDDNDDSIDHETKNQLIERFFIAEKKVREAETSYQDSIRDKKPNSMSRMAYEAMLDATSQLENAFEEMINRTRFCTAKSGD